MSLKFNINSITPISDEGGGGEIKNQNITITQNGVYRAASGYTGIGTATVNVPNPSTGTLNISANGSYNVTDYATADVSIPAPILQEKTATVNGIVLPDSNYDGLSKVIVDVPEAVLISKNITQNGTYSAINDNADGYSSVTVNVEGGITPSGTLSITENGTYDVTNYASAAVAVSGGGGDSGGKYLVQVIDYDGTILKSDHLNTGDTFTLPTPPSNHERLTFQEWTSPVTITDNTVTVGNSDITIGATYTTVSGLCEFDITLNKVTGLTITFNFDGTKNWGDGTSDTATSHTYSAPGDYTITCDGVPTVTSIFGQSTSEGSTPFNSSIIRARLAVTNLSRITNYMFINCRSLQSITIPIGYTSMGTYAFASNSKLKSIVIPKDIKLTNNAFYRCPILESVALSDKLYSIDSYAFYECFILRSITLPNAVDIIGNGAFYSNQTLKSISIPPKVMGLTTSFTNCYNILFYDFTQHTQIPTLSGTSVFSRINGQCKILVPAALYDDWIEATNWATFADYIEGV